MRGFNAIFKRELIGLFTTPAIYFYVFCMVSINVLFAFNIGQLIELNDASLISYFQFQPWLFLVFIPSLGMRAFCDDNRMGQSELLLSLPISPPAIVLAKFTALLIICIIAIGFCIPLWIWISFLGKIDNGVVLSSMFASIILASNMLAISVFVGVYNKNQTLSFIISAGICLIFIGISMPFLVSGIESLGDIGHFFARIMGFFAIFEGYDSAINGNLGIDWIILNIGITAIFLALANNGLNSKRGGHL